MGSAENRSWIERAARRIRSSQSLRGYGLLSPTLIVMGAGLAAPLVLLVLYSLWAQNDLGLDTHPTLSQYASVFTRASYRALFVRSIAISGLVTLVTVALAYPMAYFVAFRVEKTKFL